MAKKIVTLFATLAVLTPLIVHVRAVSWNEGSYLVNIFPLFGLLAFTLLWLHSVSGVFEEWLRERFNFDAYVHWTSLVIFCSIILHPLILLILAKFDVLAIYRGHPTAITLGAIGLLLLLTYDIGKLLRKREFFSKHWRVILVVSNAGFILTFFHSILIGSDLQTGFLRGLWIFYGVSAILAIIYTYGFKRVKLPEN